MIRLTSRNPKAAECRGGVYCPICTHTVEAVVETRGRAVFVKTGQKCPRCSAPLDAGYVVRIAQAA